MSARIHVGDSTAFREQALRLDMSLRQRSEVLHPATSGKPMREILSGPLSGRNRRAQVEIADRLQASKNPIMRPVTVVITTLNSEETLRACLESIREQTQPPMEIVVVDGHSRD